MTSDNQVIEKGISDVVGALTDPIIVYPGGWGETLPEWLKNTITLERLVENMRSQEGDGPTGTDAEACAYLYTAGLTAPMDSDWSKIYLYVATKTYEKWRTKDSGATMPADIRVDELSDYQISHLKRLRRWIYDQRTRARLDRDRMERRGQKEAEAAAKKAEQPALFEF